VADRCKALLDSVVILLSEFSQAMQQYCLSLVTVQSRE